MKKNSHTLQLINYFMYLSKLSAHTLLIQLMSNGEGVVGWRRFLERFSF